MKKALLLFLLLSIFVSGCTPAAEEGLQSSSDSEVAVSVDTSDLSSGESRNRFVLGQDYQFHFNFVVPSNLVESESHYYFILPDGYSFLRSKNKISGEVIPVCNKVDCLHDREADLDRRKACNASLGGVLPGTFQYYDGRLYVLYEGVDSFTSNIQKRVVREFQTDGSGYNDILELDGKLTSRMVMHRGYLFIPATDYMLPLEDYEDEQLESMSYYLECYDLADLRKGASRILDVSGEWGQMNSMFAYDDYLYVMVSGRSREYGIEKAISRGLIYDMKTGELKTLPMISGGVQFALGESIYYFPRTAEDNVSVRDMYAKSPQAVVADLAGNPTDTIDISYSPWLYGFGEYLISDNFLGLLFDEVPQEEGRRLTCYTPEGEWLGEISAFEESASEASMAAVVGINDEYIFFIDRGEKSRYALWTFRLADLGKPDLKAEIFCEFMT